MYKNVYDSWTREDKRCILEDNKHLQMRVNELNQKLATANNQLININKQKESLDKLKNDYESLKLSDDTNIALDAYVQYKEACEAQLKELNEQLNDNSIVNRCKKITILSNALLIVLLGCIIFALSAQKNSYADDINSINSSIEQLNKDNQKWQSDYNEVSASNEQLSNEISSLKTQYDECESTLKSRGNSKTNSKHKK